jgi:hypothetical protein
MVWRALTNSGMINPLLDVQQASKAAERYPS